MGDIKKDRVERDQYGNAKEGLLDRFDGGKSAVVGTRESALKKYNADDFNNYNFDNPLLQGSLDAMNSEAVTSRQKLKQYKIWINECEKNGDHQGLADLVWLCINEINKRSPGEAKIMPSRYSENDWTYGFSDKEANSPEAKAIKIIKEGGSNIVTALFGKSKMNNAILKDRDAEYKYKTENGFAGNKSANNQLYGSTDSLLQGNMNDVAQKLASIIAAKAAAEDAGWGAIPDSVIKSYTDAVSRFGNQFQSICKYFTYTEFLKKSNEFGPQYRRLAAFASDITTAQEYLNSTEGKNTERMIFGSDQQYEGREKIQKKIDRR